MRGIYGAVTGAESCFGPVRNSSACGMGVVNVTLPENGVRPGKDTIGEFGGRFAPARCLNR